MGSRVNTVSMDGQKISTAARRERLVAGRKLRKPEVGRAERFRRALKDVRSRSLPWWCPRLVTQNGEYGALELEPGWR